MPLKRHHLARRRSLGETPSPLVEELAEPLAAELRTRLEAAGETELVRAVGKIQVLERCECGDPSCASFYTLPRFQTRWLWNRGGRTIPLRRGLAVDAVGDRIVAVEVILDENERT